MDPGGSLKSVLGFKKKSGGKKLKQHSNIGHITLIGTLILMFSKAHSFGSAFVNTQLAFYKLLENVKKILFRKRSFLFLLQEANRLKSLISFCLTLRGLFFIILCPLNFWSFGSFNKSVWEGSLFVTIFCLRSSGCRKRDLSCSCMYHVSTNVFTFFSQGTTDLGKVSISVLYKARGLLDVSQVLWVLGLRADYDCCITSEGDDVICSICQ